MLSERLALFRVSLLGLAACKDTTYSPRRTPNSQLVRQKILPRFRFLLRERFSVSGSYSMHGSTSFLVVANASIHEWLYLRGKL